MTAFLGGMIVSKEQVYVLEELVKVNGTNGSVYIYDQDFKKLLSKNGFIRTNNLGWVWASEKLHSVLPKTKKSIEKHKNT